MSDEIRFGLIGCGRIAEKHSRALESVTGVRLVMTADVNEAAAQRIAAQHGARAVTDYRRVLECVGVDAVIIATPSGLHAEMAREALDAGKHVLVEKPVAMNSSDAERLIERARKVDRCLGTVHPNRHYPTSRILKRALLAGQFGRLSHGVATVRWNRTQRYYDEAPWRKDPRYDGGIILNQAWHAVDLLIWFLGPVEYVAGQSATRVHDMANPDVAVAHLRFANGALGLIEASTNVYPCNLEETVSVFGEKGTAILGGSRIDAFRQWNVAGTDSEVIMEHWSEARAPRHEPWWAHSQVLRSFLRQLHEGNTVAPEVEDAVEVLRISERVVGDHHHGSAPCASCDEVTQST